MAVQWSTSEASICVLIVIVFPIWFLHSFHAPPFFRHPLAGPHPSRQPPTAILMLSFGSRFSFSPFPFQSPWPDRSQPRHPTGHPPPATRHPPAASLASESRRCGSGRRRWTSWRCPGCGSSSPWRSCCGTWRPPTCRSSAPGPQRGGGKGVGGGVGGCGGWGGGWGGRGVG